MTSASVALFVYVVAMHLFGFRGETVHYSNWAGILLSVLFLVEVISGKTKLRVPGEFGILAIFLACAAASVAFQDHSDPDRYVTLLLVAILVFMSYNISVSIGTVLPIELGYGIGVLGSVYAHYAQWTDSSVADRAVGLYDQSNILGQAVFVTVCLLMRRLIVFATTPQVRHPVVSSLLILMVAGLMVQHLTSYSGSRRAVMLSIAAVASSLVYLAIAKRTLAACRRVVLLAIPALVLLVALALAGSAFSSRFNNLLRFVSDKSLQQEASLDIRSDMVLRGLDLIAERPVLGWGLDAYRDVAGFQMYSHNNYIELAVSLGVPGAFVYYAFYLALLRRLVGNNSSGGVLSQSCNWGIGVIALVAVGDLATVTYNDKTQWLLIAALMAVVAREPQRGVTQR